MASWSGENALWQAQTVLRSGLPHTVRLWPTAGAQEEEARSGDSKGSWTRR